MLVTVYQRVRKRFKLTYQYYSFKQRDCELVPTSQEFHTAKDRWRCPACSQLFTETGLEHHHCAGGDTQDYPRLGQLPNVVAIRDKHQKQQG